MRARDNGGSLVVIRSEAESGRFGLRLIGELDLSTIEVLEAQLCDTRERSPPSVIDISELRFLDLSGLRALRRAGHGDGSLDAHLVGATGIVRRVIELASMLAVESTVDPVLSSGGPPVAPGLQAASSTSSTAPVPVPAAR
jgi:anti-anti-sigma factor